jgi:uncharacterized coiled-coil DUF342 family protein
MVIDEFTKVLDAQDDKGMAKYGVSIDEAQVDENGDPYNWPLMAMEELADFSKYQVKEILRLKNTVKQVSSALNHWMQRVNELEKERNEAREGCEKLRKEAKEWKEAYLKDSSLAWEKQYNKERDEHNQTKIDANEMAEESAVVIEQLREEVEKTKKAAFEYQKLSIERMDIINEFQTEVEKYKSRCKDYEDKLNNHNCRCKRHALIVWGEGANNIYRVFCKECGKTLYEAKNESK